MAQRTHAIVGGGTGPEEAIHAALKDIIEKGDAVGLVWQDSGRSDGEEAAFDYVLNNEIDFVMYFADGDTPHKLFRNADQGVVQKVRNPFKSVLTGVEEGGAVLFLWDDDENPDDDPDESLIEFVFQTLGDEALVLQLNNGLAPISRIPPAPIPDVDEDETEVEVEVQRLSKEELLNATAGVVKEYGQKVGATATTKAAIIKELFPDEDEVTEPVKDTGNVSDHGTVPQALRGFATAAIRLANALEAEQD